MPRKSDWQKHVGPHLRKAIATAKRSFKGKGSMSPAKKKQVVNLQKRRESINKQIKKLKGG